MSAQEFAPFVDVPLRDADGKYTLDYVLAQGLST